MSAPVALADEAATLMFGQHLATACTNVLSESAATCVITLEGPLGAGKTSLARGVVQALGHAGTVKSPTYTLVEPYATTPPVLHMDLYRLEAPEAFAELGIDGEPGLWLVEWPVRASEFLPPVDLAINLDYDGEGRSVRMFARSWCGERIIQCLSDYLEGVA